MYRYRLYELTILQAMNPFGVGAGMQSSHYAHSNPANDIVVVAVERSSSTPMQLLLPYCCLLLRCYCCCCDSEIVGGAEYDESPKHGRVHHHQALPSQPNMSKTDGAYVNHKTTKKQNTYHYGRLPQKNRGLGHKLPPLLTGSKRTSKIAQNSNVLVFFI